MRALERRSVGAARRNAGKSAAGASSDGSCVALTALVVLAVGVIGGAYAYARYQFDQVHKFACHACVPVAAGQPYNLLVIGSDSRAGDTGQAAESVRDVLGGRRST